MKKAPENPLTKLADAAFRQAAKKVIQREKRPARRWSSGKMNKSKESNHENNEKTRKGKPEAGGLRKHPDRERRRATRRLRHRSHLVTTR